MSDRLWRSRASYIGVRRSQPVAAWLGWLTPGNWRHGIPETSGASLARLKKELEPVVRLCLFAIAATPFKRASARGDRRARVSRCLSAPQKRSASIVGRCRSTALPAFPLCRLSSISAAFSKTLPSSLLPSFLPSIHPWEPIFPFVCRVSFQSEGSIVQILLPVRPP